MLRQVLKKMIGVEKNVVNVQRCCRMNYNSDGRDSMDDKFPEVGEEIREVLESKHREISFCNVHCIGRMGTTPKVVQTKSNHTFVTFVIGCCNTFGGDVKWHPVNVNSPKIQENLLKKTNVGDRVYVSGALSYAHEGDYHKQYRIYADKVLLLQHSQKNKMRYEAEQNDEIHEEDFSENV